jgi:hypothetical protein
METTLEKPSTTQAESQGREEAVLVPQQSSPPTSFSTKFTAIGRLLHKLKAWIWNFIEELIEVR